MKKKMFFTSGATDKGASQANDNATEKKSETPPRKDQQDKFNHFNKVKKDLQQLHRDADHAKDKGWMSEEQHAFFTKQNEEAQQFIDQQLAA